MRHIKLKHWIRLNIVKTIFINFRCLPSNQAIHFPILLFRNVSLRGLKRNSIKITADDISTGMIVYDTVTSFLPPPMGVISTIQGCIEFKGKARLGCGCVLGANFGGHIIIGDNTVIGHCTKLVSRERIQVGDNVQFAWECQVFDTDFHSLSINTVKRVTNAQVLIGNNCWIGNRTTIMKGSILPDNSVVASSSLYNKQTTGLNCLYAGIPAKKIKENVVSYLCQNN